ncbi:O-succinylhomoserine sulfhydrylase [Quadrisphaera granulorum]|uniref:O-succinylhomoserine sulfhydrylase n=1 Tax=Quadrisphaera granulorum TaxID=317664 RepID=A0A315ZTT4_9ACTN|nr:O-succinylhomoserine sulfhydrylase [Quadrisphaera granulorum]PWJ48298.1 O-succinylhomoserine sulfhydrylase [Quadrisphaera granulorum]SZE98459.1 O-succinylhomoserine sulfhydrylase [Quadrisphaera granulorum]
MTALDEQSWGPATRAVRGGLARSGFDETAEALYLTSGFVYSSAAEAEAAFAGEHDRFVYSRFSNPTVKVVQDRLALIEGAAGCWGTSTGMAAVYAALQSLVRHGDRVVASRALFGSCYVICDELLPRWGVEVEFVDAADLGQWERALSRPTTAVFFETPSNPTQELVDVRAVSQLAHAAGATVVVDNVFASPVLQKPLELGADVVVYSTTKHLDGQGRTLGGAVLGTEAFFASKAAEDLETFIRHTGPSMSPFTAWVLASSLGTLELRVQRMSASALAVAEHLQGLADSGSGAGAQLASVRYPWLPSHPQHELARAQMSGGGSVVTLELAGGKPAAFAFLDALQLVDISNNLGDAKSLATHPATTTHRRLGPEGRAAAGITDGTVRLSVGLEDEADLVADVSAALAAAAGTR